MTDHHNPPDLASIVAAAFESHGRLGTRVGHRASDAHLWWRRVCPVPGTPVLMSGDLHRVDADARRQLAEWELAGVTHVLDVRYEHTDERRVRAWAPGMRYIWLGVDDHGGRQEAAWFERGVEQALAAFAAPGARLMVHCHMGVNRGPSMAYAILLALGWNPVEALEAISAARPIAGIIYALDAVDWWHGRCGTAADVAQRERAAVAEWLVQHQVDVAWIVSRIRRSEVA